MADVEAQSRQPEQVVTEPVPLETQAVTAVLSEISTQPSKDPLQEAIQRGDTAWLNGGQQKPGELGTADYFFSVARGLSGDKPFTAMSEAEVAANRMRGLLRTADMRLQNPDAHIDSQGALPDGRLQFTYKADMRSDRLATLTRQTVGDVNEVSKTFIGRADGLQTERLLSSNKKQKLERTYDPTKNKEGLASLRSVKEGDKVSITAGFEGRADGLKRETLSADPSGQSRVKEYSDGRREEVRVDKDGKPISKFFDAAGKPVTGEKFQEGQKALEAKIEAEKAAQPEREQRPGQKLEGEGITLPGLKAGWGPYQALQQLQREGKINLNPEQMKKEAARIRDREFGERAATSFQQGEKLEFFSPKELAERGRTPEQRREAGTESRPETGTEGPLERNTNIEQRLTDIKKALEPGATMTPESADMVRRQLSDLTPAEIQKLKAGYDKDNPNALGDAIKEKFGKMNGGLDRHAHRWAEVEGHLNRTGQPGEDKAIKLRVDALEARWAGYDNNRSLSAIQQHTRGTLLGATEEQRKGIDSSLTKLYGQGGLSELYEKGPGKNLINTGIFGGADRFTKAVIDLTTKKGVGARSPEEQAGLLNLALQSRSIDNFREVSGKDVMNDDGRKHFFDNGGLDKINEKRNAGRGGASDVFSDIQRRELQDLARTGEVSPLTQFKKAVGVTSNTESALTDAVKRVAEDPKLREIYLDGRELARSKKEPTTDAQRNALEYYNELQKTFKSAFYFGSDRKAQNFDSQIANGPKGALSNGKLFDLGASNWQHTSDLFTAIEGATPDQLNPIFDGARIVDGKPQSGGLTDGKDALARAVNREANRERLDALLDKKVAFGVELGQIADKIKDTPLGKPIDAKTLQELRDKVPAFKGMSPEKMQQVVEGYRLDQAVRSKTIEPTKLSKAEQQQLVAFRNINAEKNPQESALKGFLQGREMQRNIDGILNAPGDSAGTRDRKMNEYLKGLKPEEARSLDMFRNIRNDAVQTNVRRDLKESIGDAKDQQALLRALKDATPAEQERLKTPEYQKEIRDLVERSATNPATKMASTMILDSYASGKPLSKAENASINALEKVANGNMSPFERQKAVIDSLKESLRTDKDGSLAKELGSNEQTRKALELAVGGDRKFNSIIKPLLETGMVPTAQLQRIYGSGGAELFKAGVLESTPQGLKHLGSPAGQADKEALLKGLTPEGKLLAEKIIKQGEVKPEDRQRAFVLGYETQGAALEQLKGMPAQQRVDMVRSYNKAFGSNLQEDLLKKVDEVEKPTVTLLATENQLTGEQSVVRSREAISNSTSTWLGSQGLKYDSSVFRSLSDLNLADRQYRGQIPPDVMDKRIKDLAANLKSFEGTKEELANMIVEGVVTAAAVAATPFTGGASLSALMLTARFAALSSGGGLAGSLLKAQLTGNYDHLAGDILKFGVLTGANLLGGEALTAFTGLGGRAATRTVEKAFAEPVLAGVVKEATPAVREQLTKGLAELIQRGYTAGGVTDDAVRGLVNGIQGLSKESKELLAKGLTDNLSTGVREISTEGLKKSVDKLGRAGRTLSLEGSAAYIGDVTGEMARQAHQGKVDLGQAVVGGVNSFFLGSGARGAIDSARALRAARHSNGVPVDRSVPAIIETRAQEVGAERTPRGPKDKEITLDRSEYQWLDDPAGLIEGPKTTVRPFRGAQEVPGLHAPPDQLRIAGPSSDLSAAIAKPHRVSKGWTAPADAVDPPVAPGHMRLYRGVKEEALGTEFAPQLTKDERKLFDQMVMGDIPRDKWTEEQLSFYKHVSQTRAFQGGKYFSDNLKTAKDYAGESGKVIYVDVPTEFALRHSKEAVALPTADGKLNYNATVYTMKSDIALTAREHALSPTNPHRLAEKAGAHAPRTRIEPAINPEDPDYPHARLLLNPQDFHPRVKGDDAHIVRARNTGETVEPVTQPQVLSRPPVFAGAERTIAGIEFTDHGILKDKQSIAFGRTFINQGLDNPRISSKHANVGVDDAGVYVQDLQSRNGTFIVRHEGGVRREIQLKPGRNHYLKEGDEIWLASPKEGLGHKLEIAGISLREKLPTGIEIETVGAQLHRLRFPDGMIAEKTPNGWREVFPPGHPKEGVDTNFGGFGGHYDINHKGEVVRITNTQEVTHFNDGRIGKKPSENSFRVEGNVAPEIQQKLARAYLDVPESVRNFIYNQRGIVRIGETLHHLDDSLKGQIPRGHDYSDASWSRIEGAYSPNGRQVLVAEKYRLKAEGNKPKVWIQSDRPEGVLRHELGHAFDDALGRYSNSAEFIAAYNRDIADHLSKMKPKDIERIRYYHQTPADATTLGSRAGRSETMAEMFGIINGGGSSAAKQDLMNRAFPNIRKLLEEKQRTFDS